MLPQPQQSGAPTWEAVGRGARRRAEGPLGHPGDAGRRARGRVSRGDGTEPVVVNWGSLPLPPSHTTRGGRDQTTRATREGPRLPKDLSLSPQGRRSVSPGKWHGRAARSSVPGRLRSAGYLILSLSPLAARLGSRGSQLALL